MFGIRLKAATAFVAAAVALPSLAWASSSEIRTRAATVKPIPSALMTLPRARLPGARYITSKQWRAMANVPSTGLFMVDMKRVPRELPTLLRQSGYRLSKDGTLRDRRGRAVAVFVNTRYFRVRPNLKGALAGLARYSDTVGGQSGARAATKLACIATSAWAVYRNGCKSFEARTYVINYRACSRSARSRRISFVEARVTLGKFKDRETCFDCRVERARVASGNLCYWPARKTQSPRHYAYVSDHDGAMRVHRNWRWPTE